ncbi:hypothetical protein KUTeg_016907 [Tegillarca granosa]|uniref:Transposable element P transposase n=1 Tax=Tegillarca granosa TaxID=220873 RepID=A0ABQ9ER16_TEGGR|nr:hypothetical protein KUTeg_016907 [Tegillarca granosa]
MSIQPDLQIVHTSSHSTLYGLSYSEHDIGQTHALTSGRVENELANHVQQYVFSGLTGFRWPFANFPNTQASAAEIFVTTWIAIEELCKWGFTPLYVCMDGSANNRFFLKMHFPDSNPIASHMIANHFKNPTKRIVFLMDTCHLLKKIRNSVLSSGFLSSHQRLLTVNGKFIIWKMWIDAFNWDQSTNSFKIHNKLTDDHIFPSNAQEMKNNLAFETLDSNMLHLMKKYSETFNGAGQTEMTGVLTSSFLVSFFNDSRPIKDLSDPRIQTFTEVYDWFKAWENQYAGESETNKRYKALMTMETRKDLDFMFRGFISLLEICICEIKIEIVPSRINSDIIENIFYQQRSLYHGATTNPTYNQYRTAISSIVLGQATT